MADRHGKSNKMRIKKGQLTTNLRSGLRFQVLDLRGRNGFPRNQRGYAFLYHDQEEIKNVFGLTTQMDDQYVVRAHPEHNMWRVDKVDWPIYVAVCDPQTHKNVFGTNEEAAEVLSRHLADQHDKIRKSGIRS